jgi:ribonucleotide reductase alpha subunit
MSYQNFASEVFRKKYALNEKETWEKAVERIVEAVNPKQYKREIKELMETKAFIPGGRILFGAGRDGVKSTLLN